MTFRRQLDAELEPEPRKPTYPASKAKKPKKTPNLDEVRRWLDGS